LADVFADSSKAVRGYCVMDRREEIYEKALELFLEKGYEKTPLSQIAKELKLTKAGLYHYFSSKEELLFTIHSYSVEKDFLPILDEAEKIFDPEKRLKFFLRNYTVKTLTKNPSIKIAIQEVNNLKPAFQKNVLRVWRRAFDLVRDALSELEEAGRIRKINKTFATFAALGMCSWTFYWFDYGRKESADELADTYLNIFFDGIKLEK
jgi:AcrR family transcriptional regulator